MSSVDSDPPPARDLDSTSAHRPTDKANEDVDTCRICRGEATSKEPLFFPCKCSGSIKYVHQECLMEWLSHSQKKYCELCKTPFRFTKLYNAHMPNRIPTSVFIHRAAIHVLRLLITWCRGVLVSSVWLILLPYCMRVVWRSLFWVGDGGFLRDLYVVTDLSPNNGTADSITVDAGGRPPYPRAENTLNATSLPLSGLLIPFSQTLNRTARGSNIYSMLKSLLFADTLPASSDTPSHPVVHTTALNITTNPLGARGPSLLSDVKFFNWFPSQAANRFLIDVMEGQIITILVVVAFILIFLIREWVVQQQPVINMAAVLGEDPAAHVAAEALDAELEQGHEFDHEHDHEDDDEEEEEEEEAEEAEGEDDDDDDIEVVPSADQDPQEQNTGARELDPSVGHVDVRDHATPRSRMDPSLIEQWNHGNEYHQSTAREDKIEGEEEEPSRGIKDTVAPANADNNGVQTTASSVSFNSTFPHRSSSLAPHSYTSGLEEDRTTPSLHRPNMPARDRSFIATGIRRNMEEREAWSFESVAGPSNDQPSRHHPDDSVPQTWDNDDEANNNEQSQNVANLVQEQADSEHSSESWQQIPDGTMSDVSQSAGPSIGKGKDRIIAENEQLAYDGGENQDDEECLDRVLGEDKILDEVQQHKEDGTTEDSSEIVRHLGEEHDEDEVFNGGAATNPEVPLAVLLGTVGTGGERNEQPDINADQPQPNPPIWQWLPAVVLDWMFGDIPPTAQAAEENANDEHIVQDLAAEAPFVAFAGNEPIEPANAPVLDPEVANAAAQAGIDLNDQDAIDDAEDLEGIMELIGMQGPLTGLFQNAMFSAVLISATLACAIWFPYLCGKVVILFAGSPISLFVKLPVRILAALCDIIVDSALCLAAGGVFWCVKFLGFLAQIVTVDDSSRYVQNTLDSISGPSRSVAESAMDRIGNLVYNSSLFPNPDYFRLSVNSHVALRSIQNTTSNAYTETSNAIATLYGNVAYGSSPETAFALVRQLPIAFQTTVLSIINHLSAWLSWIWTAKSYNITLSSTTYSPLTPAHITPDPWTPNDRLIAIFAGYTFFALVGALYLKRGAPFSTSQQGKKIERVISEVLQQAGGVLKVILIISIEMLVFPLYCGLLLDFALLPLFENASVYTRWQWTRQNPWTSWFVHWFIGTCYMFHFALFVSMCRKIMRKGVLYFIRDPDDPTFHPVRDVLERSVTTQLRKIAFSGLVYGGLVLVCLGGVVAGLNNVTTGVLPIHWASHAPSVEFPMDLLFYNFLTPLIIKVYKPSDGLQVIYKWWFETCAHGLRLSNFLFGVKRRDEEGVQTKRSWFAWLNRSTQANVQVPVTSTSEHESAPDGHSEESETDDDIVFDGRYVRAPASDQVRIPKGERVFVEVNELNERLDGNQFGGGVHNTDMVSMVYVPPWFRVRIALFVFTIWVFAAVTGLGITVTPLLFGRFLFSLFLPPAAQMNDIHAFSLGVYTLGAMAYSVYHIYKVVVSMSQPVRSPISTLVTFATTASKFGLRVLRFTYVWSSFIFLFPFLFALLLELYLLMPLHAYLGPKEPHVIHVIQDWTLGFLYARLAAHVTFSNRMSRAARAFGAVVANGYFDPNARIATRYFLIPVLAIFLMAVTVPASVAFMLNKTVWASADQVTRNQIWRFSFPLVGLTAAAVWLGREGVGVMNRWKMVVRDEVYLIGERLHNFGDRRPANGAQAVIAKN